MAEHFPDATKKMDFISREDALDAAWHNYYPSADHYCVSVKCATRQDLEAIPPADVVTRDCYDRILAENDTMREMLAQIGKKPGDKMDDVRPVAKGRWIKQSVSFDLCGIEYFRCSCCDREYQTQYNVCPNCGADMKETGR